MLTDFGLDDEFVGILHAVIARRAPAAKVVDLTHGVAPHDIRGGALVLWRCIPWLVPGVVVAVVDPGVGTERRAVAVEVAGAGAVLIGPDNGLLLPALARLGGATAAVELAAAEGAPGATFDGRDRFAPAAARVAVGEPLEALGTPVDPSGLQGDAVPEAALDDDGRLRTEVLWVDRFGNAQLNVTPADVRSLLGAVGDAVTPGGYNYPVRIVGSYGEIESDGVALVVDSYGLLALSANRRSAAAEMGLGEGDAVRLCRARPEPR